MMIDSTRKYPASLVRCVLVALAFSCTACTDDGQSAEDSQGPVSNEGLLTESNWEGSLDIIMQVIGAEHLRLAMESAKSLRLPDASFEGSEGIESLGEETTFVTGDGVPGSVESAACSDGGGFEILRTAADFGYASIDADECVLGPLTIDGKVVLVRMNEPNYNEIQSAVFTDFDISDTATHVQMSQGSYQFEDLYPVDSSTWGGVSYTYTDENASGEVVDLERDSAAIWGAVLDRSLSISFSLDGAWMNGVSVSVSTPESFGGLTTSSTGKNFTFGTLLIETSQGERLTLQPDGNQGESALITVESEGGVTTYYRDWPEALR